MPLLSLGFLWLVLWQGHLRWFGLPAIVLSFALWQGTTRPDVLVADTGTLVGVMTPAGRALSKDKAAGFVARNWLENDGDGADQAVAAQRWAGQEEGIIHLSGKRAVAAFSGCQPEDVVVASADMATDRDWGCQVYDPLRLRKTGAIALNKSAQGWEVTTAKDRAGTRLWNSRPQSQ